MTRLPRFISMANVKKWLRRTLGILLLFVLLVTALWWEENWRGRRLWEETSARLRAAGEPVELADIIPPPIPDEDNVAMTPIFAEVLKDGATARLTKLGEAFPIRGVTDASGKTLERPEAFVPLAPNVQSQLDAWRAYLRALPSARVPPNGMAPADELLFHLSTWQDAIDDLGTAVRRPDCRWQLDYAQGTRMEHPMRDAASAAAGNVWPWLLAYAAKGDTERHLELTLTQLRLARWIDHDGDNMLSYMVSSTIRSRALGGVQNMVPLQSCTADQLLRLQAELSNITLNNLLKAVRQERVLGCYYFRRLSAEELTRAFKAVEGFPFGKPSKTQKFLGTVMATAIGRRPQGWNMTDAALYADFIQGEVLPCVDAADGMVLRSNAEHLELACKDFMRRADWYSLHRGNLVGNYPGLMRIGAQTQAQVHEALVWCAIERFLLKHGSIPANLEELVPEFLAKVPCDPANGLSLRYVRKDERDYLLYSIGWNGVDDGGFLGRRRDQGDWVWASDPKFIEKLDDVRSRSSNAIAEALAAKKKAGSSPAKAAPKK